MAHDARMNLKKWDSVTCRDCLGSESTGSGCTGSAQEVKDGRCDVY